jgi:hypothetical protein
MDDQERRHIEELIGLYTRRLHILEKQIASAGIRTPPEIQIECEDVKRKLEELKGQTEHSSVVTVELITHGSSGLESGATERIDWTALFDGGLPSADAWSEQLLPELYRLKARIVQGGGQVIALRAKAHLSACLAFGYVFRAPTGYRLWVEQSDLHTRQAQWWRTDEKPLLETPLEQERTAGPSRAKNTETSVEISAASDVDIRAAVRQSILQHKLPIRERIHLRLPLHGKAVAVQSGPHALAMALQIRAAIRAVRNANPQQTIHLFGAMPFGMAVLLGAQLNACEQVQCYEFDRMTNTYQMACRLSPS